MVDYTIDVLLTHHTYTPDAHTTHALLPTASHQDTGLCGAYVLTEYVLWALIMLGIIMAINYNLTTMRLMLRLGDFSRTTPSVYGHLLLFEQFRWVFFAYVRLGWWACVLVFS